MSNGIQNGQQIEEANFRGIIFPYAGSSAPTGFLLCDGTAVSRVTYSDLYTLIGDTYGAGNGTTTFNVPDLRSSVPVGKGQKTYTYSIAGSGVTSGANGYVTFGSDHDFEDAENVTVSGSVYDFKVYKSGQGTDTGSAVVDASGNISAGAPFCAVAPVGTPVYCYAQVSSNFSASTVYWVISNSGTVITLSATKGGGIAGSGNAGNVSLNTGYSPASYYASIKSATEINVCSTQADVFTRTYLPILADTSSGTYTVTSSRTLTNRALGDDGGKESFRIAESQLPSHFHSSQENFMAQLGGGSGGGSSGNLGKTLVTDSKGGNVPITNMPPFVTVNYIIKT
jgi:microcystin-dependent protein